LALPEQTLANSGKLWQTMANLNNLSKLAGSAMAAGLPWFA
jgi:hypothetical protein